MKTEIRHRDTCRLCGSAAVEVVLALAPMPLSENYGADAESARRVKRLPVDLYMCRQCGHVQHLDVTDSQSLWANYTNYSGDSKGMPEHFAAFAADVLRRYSIPPGSLVVDIGSNDGSLLKPFKAAGHRVIGIDPAEAIARMATDAGIPTVPEPQTPRIGCSIKWKVGNEPTY